MPRLPHHNKNYGGARKGAGRKKNGANRMTFIALEKAEEAKIHPFDYLLSVVADKKAHPKERLSAAQSALPYCVARLSSTEVNIKHALTDESEEALVNRLLTAQNQLVQLGLSVIESEAVNQ